MALTGISVPPGAGNASTQALQTPTATIPTDLKTSAGNPAPSSTNSGVSSHQTTTQRVVHFGKPAAQLMAFEAPMTAAARDAINATLNKALYQLPAYAKPSVAAGLRAGLMRTGAQLLGWLAAAVSWGGAELDMAKLTGEMPGYVTLRHLQFAALEGIRLEQFTPDQRGRYIVGTAELRELAMNGKITAADMKTAIGLLKEKILHMRPAPSASTMNGPWQENGKAAQPAPPPTPSKTQVSAPPSALPSKFNPSGKPYPQAPVKATEPTIRIPTQAQITAQINLTSAQSDVASAKEAVDPAFARPPVLGLDSFREDVAKLATAVKAYDKAIAAARATGLDNVDALVKQFQRTAAQALNLLARAPQREQQLEAAEDKRAANPYPDSNAPNLGKPDEVLREIQFGSLQRFLTYAGGVSGMVEKGLIKTPADFAHLFGRKMFQQDELNLLSKSLQNFIANPGTAGKDLAKAAEFLMGRIQAYKDPLMSFRFPEPDELAKAGKPDSPLQNPGTQPGTSTADPNGSPDPTSQPQATQRQPPVKPSTTEPSPETPSSEPAADGVPPYVPPSDPPKTGGGDDEVPPEEPTEPNEPSRTPRSVDPLKLVESIVDWSTGVMAGVGGLSYLGAKAQLGEVGITTADKLPGLDRNITTIFNQNSANNAAGPQGQLVIYTTKPGSKEADGYCYLAMGASFMGSKIIKIDQLVSDVSKGRFKPENLLNYIDGEKMNFIAQSLPTKSQTGGGVRGTAFNAANAWAGIQFGPPDLNWRSRFDGNLATINVTARAMKADTANPKNLAPWLAQAYANLYMPAAMPGQQTQAPNVGRFQLSLQNQVGLPAGLSVYSVKTNPIKFEGNAWLGQPGKLARFEANAQGAKSTRALTFTFNGNKSTRLADLFGDLFGSVAQGKFVKVDKLDDLATGRAKVSDVIDTEVLGAIPDEAGGQLGGFLWAVQDAFVRAADKTVTAEAGLSR